MTTPPPSPVNAPRNPASSDPSQTTAVNSRVFTHRSWRSAVREMPEETLSHSFKNSCGAHAAADAHRDHAVLRVLSLEIACESSGEFCAGAAERMAESDCAAVWIDARCVEACLL